MARQNVNREVVVRSLLQHGRAAEQEHFSPNIMVYPQPFQSLSRMGKTSVVLNREPKLTEKKYYCDDLHRRGVLHAIQQDVIAIT